MTDVQKLKNQAASLREYLLKFEQFEPFDPEAESIEPKCPACERVDKVSRVADLIVSSASPELRARLSLPQRAPAGQESRWEIVSRKWKELFYCARCDGVFADPPCGRLVPTRSMMDFLLGGAALLSEHLEPWLKGQSEFPLDFISTASRVWFLMIMWSDAKKRKFRLDVYAYALASYFLEEPADKSEGQNTEPAVRYCSYCGQPLPEVGEYCPHCGKARLQPGEPKPQSALFSDNPPRYLSNFGWCRDAPTEKNWRGKVSHGVRFWFTLRDEARRPTRSDGRGRLRLKKVRIGAFIDTRSTMYEATFQVSKDAFKQGKNNPSFLGVVINTSEAVLPELGYNEMYEAEVWFQAPGGQELYATDRT